MVSEDWLFVAPAPALSPPIAGPPKSPVRGAWGIRSRRLFCLCSGGFQPAIFLFPPSSPARHPESQSPFDWVRDLLFLARFALLADLFQVPPGVPAMKRLKDAITYEYVSTEKGARVVISTTNPDALSAIHDFLRFQIHEHQTGDKL
jgi:hypothetical protein